MKHAFMEAIGFLKWAQLDPDDVAKLGFTDIGKVMLSPDVKSLHLVWENGDGTIQHELVDYGRGRVEEFLRYEIQDDSIEDWDEPGMESIYSIISDWHEYTPDNTPIVTLAALNQALVTGLLR